MELLKDFRTWRFFRHLLTHSFVCFGVLSTILQTISLIDSTVVFFHGWAFLIKILGISLVWGIFKSWPRPLMQEYSAPKTKISIVKGNILDDKNHLVIGINDTFDTETPNIISLTSLQGQALNVLFGGDLKDLDDHLDKALANKTAIGEIIKVGKQKKFGVGAIGTIKQNARLIFFLAYSEMDANNNAHTTPDKIWKSLLALWEEVAQKGNGGVLSMPVIGGGQARLSSILPAQDAIRFTILSFMLASRKIKVCDELRIVVTPQDFKKLDRLELQSFLKSMCPS